MDTFSAFSRGIASRHNPVKVFDWFKAATLIKERGAISARAGLRDDWEWTGGDILRNGTPVPKDETYVYLASTWAIPELVINDEDPIECYQYEDQLPNWGAETYWPPEAIEILNS